MLGAGQVAGLASLLYMAHVSAEVPVCASIGQTHLALYLPLISLGQLSKPEYTP